MTTAHCARTHAHTPSHLAPPAVPPSSFEDDVVGRILHTLAHCIHLPMKDDAAEVSAKLYAAIVAATQASQETHYYSQHTRQRLARAMYDYVQLFNAHLPFHAYASEPCQPDSDPHSDSQSQSPSGSHSRSHSHSRSRSSDSGYESSTDTDVPLGAIETLVHSTLRTPIPAPLLKRLFDGWSALRIRKRHAEIAACEAAADAPCSTLLRCYRQRADWVERYFTERLPDANVFEDAGLIWKGSAAADGQEEFESALLCDACGLEFMKVWEEERQSIREELPHIFAVDTVSLS